MNLRASTSHDRYSVELMRIALIVLVLFYTGAGLARLQTDSTWLEAEAEFLQLFSHAFVARSILRLIIAVFLPVVALVQSEILRFLVRLVFPQLNFTWSESFLFLLISQIPWMIYSGALMPHISHGGVLDAHALGVTLAFTLIHTLIYLALVYYAKPVKGLVFVVLSLFVAGVNLLFGVLSH